MKRLPWELLALPALGIARLLPETGGGLYVRLAAATACLLLPGALIARALGRPGVSGALAWSLAGLFGASAVMFAVHGSLSLALILYAAIGAVALPFALRPKVGLPSWPALAVAGAGVGFGIALWHVAGTVDGDALFHLARIRKLEAFGHLHLRTVDEFVDGGLHPGYAFPLWHVLLALVARLGGVDPALVVQHEASVLVPVAFAVSFEAGVAVFRNVWAGFAVLVGQVALIGLAPGHGGFYTALPLPATAARQILVPAVIALFFFFVRGPTYGGAATIAAGGSALALVHPTYALFVAIPLGGYVVVRTILVRAELVRGVVGLAALVGPTLLAYLWLLPLARETASHAPSAAERARGFAKYRDQLSGTANHFHLSPEVFARTGAVAVVALVAVPLAALAGKRRWAAFVLGGSLIVLGLTLVPTVFTRFSDAVSLSQARRAAGFIPFAFAFAGAAVVLTRVLWIGVLPLALLAGVWLERDYPGNYAYGAAGGPAIATWIAVVGALAGLAAALLLRRWSVEKSGPLVAAAALLFVLPIAVHGFKRWTASPSQPSPLTAGLVAALDRSVPKGSVVFSDDGTSYWLSAALPVYVASSPPGHVAGTKANRPRKRRADAFRFFRTGDLAIPRRYHAGWIVVDRQRWRRLRLSLPRVYVDRQFALYRLQA